MSLAERLARQIAAGGPISIAAYMTACLHDPSDGYYAARPRVGVDGDFITAPQVSQVFGELVGLWASDIWAQLGAPSSLRLIELGPGDGTLMADALRATRRLAGFRAACRICLVESSAPLREAQRRALEDVGAAPAWVSDIEELSLDGPPAIVVANEFLDCLPIQQWVSTSAGLAERRVGVDENGALTFVLAPAARPLTAPCGMSDGETIEASPEVARVGANVGRLVARCGGAALFIDYARDEDAFGDTLQAVRGHAKECPLAHPGSADLTCRPDFGVIVDQALAAGAKATDIVSQHDFLRGLGIEARISALVAANPARAATLERQRDRLIGVDQMGRLFKAVCVHSAGLSPPGF